MPADSSVDERHSSGYFAYECRGAGVLVRDGGQNAARGFRYQYRRTLEALVVALDDPAVAAIGVEGSAASAGAEVVDFDLTGHDGHCLRAVQVKSKSPGLEMSAAEAFGVLARLAREVDADRYELLTNAEPGPGASHLAKAFTTERDSGSLHDGVAAILRGAERRTADLEWLVENHPDRLARMRLSFDDRDEQQVAVDLREALRHVRNRSRRGLGDHSAGLLSGYLIDEIFDRAADRTRCRYTMAQFREQVLVDGAHLAAALTVKDWGVVAGQMPTVPDIVRPALLRRLKSHFAGYRSTGVERLALVGASGIGKTSLTAAFLADQADSYQLIMWVDAGSEASLVESFRMALAALRSDSSLTGYAGTVAQLRAEVHRELSRLSGRWAMVFDNVHGPREVQAWLPSLGVGDVLILSINAAVPYGSTRVVTIAPMEVDEAVALLGARLGVSPAASSRGHDALVRLAEELGYWPLALELGAGYLTSCDISLDRVDEYLTRLKIRSLSDEESLPPTYPRTLAAVIRLCLDDLNRRQEERPPGGAPSLGAGILRMAAYLAERQIPVHVLAAAVAIADSDDPVHRGPLIISPDEFNLAEDMRDLRRYSIVDRDAELPAVDDTAPGDVRMTVKVNTVVQDLLRADCERLPGVAVALDRLAFHLSRWLGSAIDLGYLPQAFVLFTHADVLVGHLRRLGVVSDRVANLWGNLAGVYQAQGDMARSAQLLREELDLLDHIDTTDGVLAAQTHLSLANILLDPDDEDVALQPLEAATHLQQVHDFVQQVAGLHPNAAVHLAYMARATLNRPRVKQLDDARLNHARSGFQDVLDGLPATPATDAAETVQRAAQMLADSGADAEAERLLREGIATGLLVGPIELEARRLLFEATARQQHWEDAGQVFAELKSVFGDAPLHYSVVGSTLHNVGLACALHIVMDIAPASAARLLGDMLDWPVAVAAMARSSGGRLERIRLLTAIRHLASHEYGQVEAALSDLNTATFAEGVPSETPGWLKLRQLARLSLLQNAGALPSMR